MTVNNDEDFNKVKERGTFVAYASDGRSFEIVAVGGYTGVKEKANEYQEEHPDMAVHMAMEVGKVYPDVDGKE